MKKNCNDGEQINGYQRLRLKKEYNCKAGGSVSSFKGEGTVVYADYVGGYTNL